VAIVGAAVAAPQITQQPRSQSAVAGGNVTLSVSATGSGPLMYQWFRDGVAVNGATAASLTLTSLTTAQAGQYHVEVSNAGGMTPSMGVYVVALPVGGGTFPGSDNFNDNSRDTARWGTTDFGPAGALVEANGRLEFRNSTPNQLNVGWVPQNGTAPYAQDWEARVRVNLPALSFPADGFAVVGLAVVNSADPGDRVTVELDAGRELGGAYRQFLSAIYTNDVDVPNLDLTASTASTSATLRARWVAATARLHLEYDADGPANGEAWTLLRTFDPAATWGMSSGSFLIAIGGDSENRVITSGDGLWLDDFAASTDHIPLTGLSSNREGVVNWNVFPTNGNVELPRFGHELTWLRGVPPYSNYFAYYYLASREYDGIDALSTSALRAGTPTGFPNLVSALATNGFNISQLRVRFGLMTLGNDDALVWSYDPAQRVENRRYQGGIVRFQLNGQDLIAGPMPDFTFTIRYNELTNHLDDQISGVTGTVSPTNNASGSSPQVQAVAAALLADIGPGAIRLVMDSIQPEIQVEFSQPGKGRIGGFFEAQSGRIELIGLPNPQGAPVITAQPQNQVATATSNVTFSVTATGSGLTYQWRKNGTPILGETAASLTLNNVTRAASGTYSVVVTSGGSSTTSSDALLRVIMPQQLQPPQRGAGGQFQLRFADPDGGLGGDLARFEVHHTTNFLGASTVWVTNSGTFTLSNGKILFDDTGSVGAPRRFYRVIEK
jgi:hypothetical protein